MLSQENVEKKLSAPSNNYGLQNVLQQLKT